MSYRAEKLLFGCIAFASLFGAEFGSEHPALKILPSGDQEVRQGKNIVLTCRAQVSSLELIRDIRWYDPKGQPIRDDDRIYSEEQPGEAGVALFIKRIQNEDAGLYTCKAVYASNQHLHTSVKVSLYVGITWVDAPTTQYAMEGHNYKVKCKDNAGTYTCRARVPETGELEERDIQLDGIERNKIDMLCGALGSPPPKYTWVDKDGIDATEKEGWKLNEITGTLTAYSLRRQDEGTYTCIVENNAGTMQASAFLSVIIRPRVQELYNKTYEVGHMGAELICRASGDPIPRITWRKWSINEPYLLGGQPNDPRLIVRDQVIRAPDYTEGERDWMESTIVIDGIQRKDDGLYECKAENEGGQFYKSGHITVEFAPSWEDQPMDKEWSWHQQEVNLTCIARSIPNATISWWYNNKEIGRDDLDKNFQVQGHGPRSDLWIQPLEPSYYRTYQCKAENPHGVNFHDIVLEEAKEPSLPQQAVLDKYTATTLQYRFVSPTDIGGLPIDSYAVEYKFVYQDWGAARQRVWPLDVNGHGYILESLEPNATYDLRFRCKNRVGWSPWGLNTQISTRQRQRPEMPLLSIRTESGEILFGDVVELPRSKDYEVSWQIPEDNGAPIDFFKLTYFPVHKRGTSWERIGDIKNVEIPHRGNVRWGLQLDYQDTFYQVGLQAHNRFGYSPEEALIIKTPKDLSSPPAPPKPNFHTNDHPRSSANTILATSCCVVMATLLLIAQTIFRSRNSRWRQSDL